MTAAAKCESIPLEYPQVNNVGGVGRERILNRNGRYKMKMSGWGYTRKIRDMYNTFLDLSWWKVCLIYPIVFIISWLFFGLFWYQLSKRGCLANVETFYSAFLFSLETQRTIGYGHRYIKQNCVSSYMVLALQCCVGIVIQALMVGMMYDRFSKNTNRTQTILFSKNAVICQRDSFPCFVFRAANMQPTGLVDCQVVLKFLYSTVTEENETILLDSINLEVGEDNVSQEIEFCTPVLVAHRITPLSPLYNCLLVGLEDSQFEILVLLTGCDEATGVTIQARMSYLPSDIVPNHRFVMIESLSNSNDWVLDFKKFNMIQRE